MVRIFLTTVPPRGVCLAAAAPHPRADDDDDGVLGPRAARARLDAGRRYLHVLCMLSDRPLLSLFKSVLRTAHALLLLRPDALAPFLARLRAPRPFPMPGESLVVRLPPPAEALRRRLQAQAEASAAQALDQRFGQVVVRPPLSPPRGA